MRLQHRKEHLIEILVEDDRRAVDCEECKVEVDKEILLLPVFWAGVMSEAVEGVD